MQYLRTGCRLKAATESSSHALDTCWWAQLLLQPSSSDSLLAEAASLNTSGCRVSESCCLLALQNSAGCLLMGRPTGGRDRRVAPAALASAARSAWACRLLFMYSCTPVSRPLPGTSTACRAAGHPPWHISRGLRKVLHEVQQQAGQQAHSMVASRAA